MSTVLESGQELISGLEHVTTTRRIFAGYLVSMAEEMERAEGTGSDASGQMGLQAVIDDLRRVADSLERGAFRLLVLGDMKRGKSTFLNALLGENILPRDVNPCTAVLTVLRYGERPGVTIHHRDDKPSRTIDVETFRREYTIPRDVGEQLEKEGADAFPDVDYAVLEVPLPLLEHGVEIIDSPGLNDTEARNELTLGYVRECHAILFVLSATQQWTLAEKRYLANYVRDRGLSVFFLINMWDDIARRLDDPDDPAAVAMAEREVRKEFRSSLAHYCRVEGQDVYERRVFEISALQALRARLAGRPLEGTGFARFTEALGAFLVNERGAAELGLGRTAARAAALHVRRAVETRIPLLYLPAEELEARIAAVEPEFHKLEEIRDRLLSVIETVRRRLNGELSADFHAYLTRLTDTFEEDFTRYDPGLKFMEFLRRKERERFAAGLEAAFGRYLNDRVSEWSRSAEGRVRQELDSISATASAYALSYSEVTHTIAAELVGGRAVSSAAAEELGDAPVWQRVLAGAGAVLVGDFAGGLLAGSGVFNWKRIVANVAGVAAAAVAAAIIFGVVLTPLGVAILGLLMGVGQAERARRKMLRVMREELGKSLPALADQGRMLVERQVDSYFERYHSEVGASVNDDIAARRVELENLVARKRESEVDVRAESERLRALERAVSAAREAIEGEYDRYVEHR